MNHKELRCWHPLNNQGNPTGSFCCDCLEKTECDFSFDDSKIDTLCILGMCISKLCGMDLKDVSSQRVSFWGSTDRRGRVLLCHNSCKYQIETYTLILQTVYHAMCAFFDSSDIANDVGYGCGLLSKKYLYPE